MSIFENYTSNFPMFFPSYEFMIQLRQKYGRQGVLSQLSWKETFSESPGCVMDNEKLKQIGDFNDYTDINNEKEWIKLADYYDEEWMPHIQYFNSFEQLVELLNTVDTLSISNNMKLSNKIRKQKVYSYWADILNRIS